MDDYTQFHSVFKPEFGSPYGDADLLREVEAARKSFNGQLFIDRVLKALGITKAKAYPPRNGKALYDLHERICSSKSTVHHKLSILFYLLTDFDSFQGREGYADHFAANFGLPDKYKLFMKGLWLLDRSQLEVAVEYLAHPSLFPEFSDDIITVLVQKAKNDDYSLALSYYHAVQPVLTSSAALSSLFEALAKTSLIEAFYFSRTKPEPARQLLFQQLISSVLGGNKTAIASRATELVSLPLDSVEDGWFEDYLTTGEGRKLTNAKDTVLMRRVVTGRHAESMNDKSLGSQWSAVLGGFKSGMGGRVA
ncbi:nuclear pore complex assembly-domain-containing protein [Coniella lustricola]|uniref:Nuclear pore complex assembly-domain-containing protein n=1 Tax=Coniella lustricola TaxID=2025994 RepID=A0A2T3AAA7_9PEZI|nr:nuclear pore complex assembly-domain-containing protein [Coniella lustricola]